MFFTGGINISDYVYAHRCHWCGKEILASPVILKAIDFDFNLICSDCFKYRRESGKIIIDSVVAGRINPYYPYRGLNC